MTISAFAGIGKPGIFAFDHFERLAANAADKFVFRHAIRNFDAARQEREGIVAERHGHFERLAACGVFFSLDAAVFARRNIEADLVLVMDHDSIGAVIHPAFVGILGDIDAAGTDVAATVLVMPERCWELEHVDIAVFVDVIEKPALLNELRRDWLDLLVIVFPDFYEIHLGFARRQSEGQRQAFPR